MTESEKLLALAYAMESVSASRNQSFAQKAEKEGRLQDAARFRAVAQGQTVHADKALQILTGTLGDTDTNIQRAQSDSEALTELFHDGIMTAARDRAPAIESALTHFMKTSMNHASLLKQNRESSDLFVCQICGFIAETEPPERCPVCRAAAEQFDSVM